MTLKHAFSFAAATIALASATMPALAVTHIVNLTGTVANGSYNTFDFGGSTYNTWALKLNGLPNLLLNQGDTVEATITLDQSFTVPGSGETFFGFNLEQGDGSVQPAEPVSTFGSMTFFNPGGTGLPNDTVGTGCGNCLSSIAFIGSQSSFAFKSIQTSFTIGELTDIDFLIDGASISYQLRDLTQTAVPEPATWGMMILGFGAIGSAMRRKRIVPAITSTANT